MAPSARIFTRFGPSAPRWSHTDAEPGPPLNENISGRAAGFATPSSVYAMKNTFASVSPVSLLSGSMPVVTVYLSGFPPTRIWWCVTTGSFQDDVSAGAAGFGASAAGFDAANAGDASSDRTHGSTSRRMGGFPGKKDGGESGIRTHETVLASTRFPIVLLQPLGHLSATRVAPPDRPARRGCLSRSPAPRQSVRAAFAPRPPRSPRVAGHS